MFDSILMNSNERVKTNSKNDLKMNSYRNRGLILYF